MDRNGTHESLKPELPTDNTSETKKVKGNPLYRFIVRNTATLTIIFVFLLLSGMVWFIYFTFIDRTNDQDVLLHEIREAQNESKANREILNTIQSKVDDLENDNDGLKKDVCILQEQLLNIGVEPAVEKDPVCMELLAQ
jgi:hypothetical protein